MIIVVDDDDDDDDNNDDDLRPLAFSTYLPTYHASSLDLLDHTWSIRIPPDGYFVCQGR